MSREGIVIVTVLVTDLNTQLLRTAEQLASEYTGLPAGSVLRCYSRAVRHLRAIGTAGARLAPEAEALTRRLLDRRGCSSTLG